MTKLLFGATLCAAFLLTSCQQPQTGVDTEEGDEQTMDSLLTAYEQAWESGEASSFDNLLASGFTRTVNEGDSYGIDSLKQVASGEGAIENMSIDLIETIYGDDNAAASWTLAGTVAGESVSIAGASFITFEDGMIASERAFFDTAPITEALMQAEGDGDAASEMQPEAGTDPDTTDM